MQGLDDGDIGGVRGRGAAQQGRVAGLQTDAAGVGGDVGPGLVDDPDHPERHPQLADPQPVVGGPAADHIADRVGQAGHLAQPVGHRGDPLRGEPQPVDQRGGGAVVLRGTDVLGIGGQDRLGGLQEGVRHRVESGVLHPGRGHSEHLGGVTSG
ncbi:hypothetical protein SDC9_76531 [bioreactor metagenome]|uniref:Uncharacterized protein n=1 Tax=bioreactor metagenome TaxID=1076179 RepID=A0A644YNV4_9ZZZZ